MYFEEDGKTFYDWGNGKLTRAHDANYNGRRFEYRRCPFCSRITCTATLHWLNHIETCAPKNYTYDDLLRLRSRPISEIHPHYKKGQIAHDRH